jgi:hypothetical protein
MCIQQYALGLRPQQGLMGMLAMDIHELLADFFELRQCCRLSIDPGFRLSCRIHHPTNQQFVGILVRLQLDFGQPGPRVSGIGEVKARREIGLCRAFAYDSCISAAPEQQIECINQNGFSGTRLAGHDGKALAKVKIELLDNYELLHRQRDKHGVS